MALLLSYLFLALFVSSLCSIMEAVLLSTPQSYIMAKEAKGQYWPKIFSLHKQNIDRPLSAILTLNTIAHTIGAAGVGAQAIKVFGEAYFGIVSAILTVLILLFTEIIPKTIGARYWRNLAKVTAYIIRGMIIFTYPLVIISSYITKAISKGDDEMSTSREEISALASIGADEGIFSEKEHKIIQNILRLKNVKVTDIMTPRIVVSLANEEMELKVFLEKKDYLHFSRIPVYHENDENITGYVMRQEILEKISEGDLALRLKTMKRNIAVIPRNATLFIVWERLLDKKEHIALIVDEYGGMDGIVTMEDIIETILGLEIMDEKDTITDMQKYARERWLMRQKKYQSMDSGKKP